MAPIPEKFQPADAADVGKSQARTRNERDNVHVLPHMQLWIAWLQILYMLAGIVVLGVFVPVLSSDYFDLSVSPVVRGKTFDGIKYWVLLAAFFAQRVIAAYATRAIGEWRMRVIDRVSKPGSVTTDEQYIALVSVMVSDFVVGWVRYAVTIVFMFAHLSFALAFALGHISVQLVGNFLYVSRYEYDYEERAQELKPKKSQQHIVAAVLQGVEVVGLFVVFWYVDFVHTDYFHFGPPLPVFGFFINSDWWYSVVVIAAFVNQMLASAVGQGLITWLSSVVYNNACITRESLGYSFADIRFIAYTHNIVTWVNTILVVNLALQQFIFTLVLFAGDLVVFSIYTHNRVKRICDKTTEDSIPCPGPKTLAIMELVQGVLVLIIAIVIFIVQATSNWGLDPIDESGETPRYFDIPPPMLLFDHLIQGIGSTVIIVIYGAAGRALMTMDDEINQPYAQNVIIAEDIEGVHYDWAHAYFILMIGVIARWYKRLIALHFVLSNILLALVQAAVSILFNALILERYLLFKARCQRKIIDAAEDIRIRESREARQPLLSLPEPEPEPEPEKRPWDHNPIMDFLYKDDNLPWNPRARAGQDVIRGRLHPGNL